MNSSAESVPLSRPTRTSGDRQLRAWLFRHETRAGVREVMHYLSIREREHNPWLWPEKPELSVVGVKNVVKRLAYDLSMYEELTGRDTSASVRSLEAAMADLELFLMMAPPQHLHKALGASLVQAYVVLHGRAYRSVSWIPAPKMPHPRTAPSRGHDRTRFGEHNAALDSPRVRVRRDVAAEDVDHLLDSDTTSSSEGSENLFSLQELLSQDSSCTRDRLTFQCLSFHALLRARIARVEIDRHRETVVRSAGCGGFLSLADLAYWANCICSAGATKRAGVRLEDKLPSPYASPRPGTWKG